MEAIKQIAPINGKVTILVTDDESYVHDLVEQSLKDLPVELLCARNGAETLILSGQVVVDLILLDIGLPDMDGFELLRRLKTNAATSSIPVIAITGHGAEQDIVKGFEFGVNDYVTKPFQNTVLRARVLSVLREKLLMDELARAKENAETEAHIKSDFFASLSHEVHVPLDGMLKSVSELLEAGLNSNQSRLAHDVMISAKRLSVVTSSMVDLLQLEAGTFKLDLHPINFFETVRECVQTLESTAHARRISIPLLAASDFQSDVEGDGRRLRLLISNILHFLMSENQNGTIAIELSSRLLSQKHEESTVICMDISFRASKGDIFRQAFQLPLMPGLIKTEPGAMETVMNPGITFIGKLVNFHGGTLLIEEDKPQGIKLFITLPFRACHATPSTSDANAASSIASARQTAISDPASQNHVPILDTERLWEAACQDLELLKLTTGIYLSDNQDRLSKLRRDFDAGNMAEVQRHAHGISGSSVTMGVVGVASRARQIEEMLMSGRTNLATEVSALEAGFAEARSAIDSCVAAIVAKGTP